MSNNINNIFPTATFKMIYPSDTLFTVQINNYKYIEITYH